MRIFDRLNLRAVLTIAASLIAYQILGVSVAYAKDITVTVTPPAQNVDGSPIPTTGTDALASHRIEYGSCAAGNFGTKIGEVVLTMPALTKTITGFNPAQYCFRAFAKNVGGNEGPATNVLAYTVPASVPGAPGLSVSAPTAYEYRPATNAMARVAFVPVGTPCGPETKLVSGVTYCRLDLSAADFVNWPTNLRLTEVWAPAG